MAAHCPTRQTKGSYNLRTKMVTAICPYCGEKIKATHSRKEFKGYIECPECEEKFFVNVTKK